MVHLLSLLLPALLPSWAFFKTVEASPRVEWRLCADRQAPEGPWHPFRPRPAELSPWLLLARLFWNPRWNEDLYLVSLSERLMVNPSQHSLDEIRRVLHEELHRNPPTSAAGPYVQFRLAFVSRSGGKITQDVCFTDTPMPWQEQPHAS